MNFRWWFELFRMTDHNVIAAAWKAWRIVRGHNVRWRK